MNHTPTVPTISHVARLLLPALLVGFCACLAPSEENDEANGGVHGDELAVVGLQAGEQTIFANATPLVPSDPDTAPVELGLKFRASKAGKITAVRFFKGRGNGGTHVGNLWGPGGARLATVKFTAETASGWQLARFASPVNVAANTTYVVSYFAPRGHYAGDNQGMATARQSGSLTALADGQEGGNGLYRYGASSMPTSSYKASNYFVDVVFRPDAAEPVADAGAGATDAGTPADAGSGGQADGGAAPGATVYGWQRTAANTGLAGAGIDRDTLPVFSGTITSGMTLSKVKLTGIVDLSNVSNVTLDRVWLRPTNNRTALVLGPGTVITSSDIDGSGSVQGERIGIYSNTSSGTFAIQRVSITNVSVGAWLDGEGAGSMTDTYIHDLVSINGAHVDGFTRRAGTGALTIARSRIDASGGYVTGAFFLQDTFGVRISGVTVADTYLEGEGYIFTLSNRGTGISFGARNVRVRAIGYGPMTTGGPITFTQWSDVYTYNPAQGPEAKGSVINHQ